MTKDTENSCIFHLKEELSWLDRTEKTAIADLAKTRNDTVMLEQRLKDITKNRAEIKEGIKLIELMEKGSGK